MEESKQHHKQPSLATRLRRARQDDGLSIGQLARDSGVDKGVISRMESGETSNPQLDTLNRLSDALRINRRELHRAAGYLDEALPSLPIYFRGRYRDMPDEAVADMERYVAHLQRKYGLSGPVDGEDEQPEDELSSSDQPQRSSGRRSRP